MASTPDLSALHTVLEQTVGYQLIGTFISLAIYGITVLQTYLYFSKFHGSDSRALRTLVFVLWVLDTACSVLVAHSLYVVLVSGWGDVSVLIVAPVTFVLENGFTVLVVGVVQLFLAHRIWLVSSRRDYVSPVLVIILATGAFGAGQALTSRIFITHRTVEAIETDHFINVSCILEQGLAATADVLITIALCFHLRKSKDNESGLKRTNNVIETLMLYFINRGVLTGIFQILHLATYIGLSLQQNWMIWHLVLSKVYVNSLLAILNARTRIRKRLDGPIAITVSGIGFSKSLAGSGSNTTGTDTRSTGNNPELNEKDFSTIA